MKHTLRGLNYGQRFLLNDDDQHFSRYRDALDIKSWRLRNPEFLM